MENRRIAIIDADSIVWESAYNLAQKGGSLRTGLNDWLFEMLNYVQATHYIGILGESGVPLKRKIAYPYYKAKRPPRPDFFVECGPVVTDYLLTEWDFVYATAGYEADDEVASWAYKCRINKVDYIICGKDKDLMQIEGKHYNYSEKKLFEISAEQADYNLLKQTLTGDPGTDNVKGIPGIGPAKADKILNEMNPYHDLWSNTLCAYRNKYGSRIGAAEFAENYQLIRLEDRLEVDLMRCIPIQWPKLNDNGIN